MPLRRMPRTAGQGDRFATRLRYGSTAMLTNCTDKCPAVCYTRVLELELFATPRVLWLRDAAFVPRASDTPAAAQGAVLRSNATRTLLRRNSAASPRKTRTRGWTARTHEGRQNPGAGPQRTHPDASPAFGRGPCRRSGDRPGASGQPHGAPHDTWGHHGCGPPVPPAAPEDRLEEPGH